MPHAFYMMGWRFALVSHKKVRPSPISGFYKRAGTTLYPFRDPFVCVKGRRLGIVWLEGLGLYKLPHAALSYASSRDWIRYQKRRRG